MEKCSNKRLTCILLLQIKVLKIDIYAKDSLKK
jgi:hypothetical protein